MLFGREKPEHVNALIVWLLFGVFYNILTISHSSISRFKHYNYDLLVARMRQVSQLIYDTEKYIVKW